MRCLAILCFVAACESSGTGASKVAESGSAAIQRGSAGGFSASLSADLASEEKGSGDRASAVGPPASGSAAVPAPVEPAKGSGDRASAVGPRASGSAAMPVPVEPAKGSAAMPAAEPDITIDTKGPVKPPPELAAIKFELLPNWERDIGEAGTIVLEVKLHGGTERKSFTFHYGYDDPRAPSDRDAYKKFLADSKILTVDLDRQRGAAWYLEGADAAGHRAFRYLVNYGGKHLICYGSLYKDAADNALGDLRDEVVIQAKKICETLSL